MRAKILAIAGVIHLAMTTLLSLMFLADLSSETFK